jgi:hypothetical protein
MRLRAFSLMVLLLVVLSLAGSAYADSILGTPLSNYAVLGGSAVTNTGPTTITGNVGVYPGTSITGESTITLTGAYDAANAGLAQSQLTTAIGTLLGLPTTQSLTGQDLGGMTLTAGVYTFSSSAQLTGALTLNAQGLANQIFVFETGSTLTTASASSVKIINPGANDALYWVIGSSATLGSGTAFEGNILAADSITMGSGSTDGCGRVLASTGMVTLNNNTISIGCGSGTGEGSGSGGLNGGGGGTTVPEPGTLVLLLSGLLPIGLLMLRKLR